VGRLEAALEWEEVLERVSKMVSVSIRTPLDEADWMLGELERRAGRMLMPGRFETTMPRSSHSAATITSNLWRRQRMSSSCTEVMEADMSICVPSICIRHTLACWRWRCRRC